MEIVYSAKAQADILFWKQSGDVKLQKRITSLLRAMEADPYTGIGKPEALKYDLTGCWSRRITKEHRIVYRVIGNEIEIVSLRFHYHQ